MNDKNAPPPPPDKPDPNECCGSGCTPCIYDYYYQSLDEWEEKYGDKKQNSSNESKGGSSAADSR